MKNESEQNAIVLEAKLRSDFQDFEVRIHVKRAGDKVHLEGLRRRGLLVACTASDDRFEVSHLDHSNRPIEWVLQNKNELATTVDRWSKELTNA